MHTTGIKDQCLICRRGGMFWYFMEEGEFGNAIKKVEGQGNARLQFISNAHFYCYYYPH